MTYFNYDYKVSGGALILLVLCLPRFQQVQVTLLTDPLELQPWAIGLKLFREIRKREERESHKRHASVFRQSPAQCPGEQA